jgi:hypothetical protein
MFEKKVSEVHRVLNLNSSVALSKILSGAGDEISFGHAHLIF